jgi:hypothetical protein
MRNFITIGSVVYERIEDKQTNKQTNILVFFIYIDRSVVYERIEDKQTNKQTNILVFFIYIDRR